MALHPAVGLVRAETVGAEREEKGPNHLFELS